MVWIDCNDDFRIYTEEKRKKEKKREVYVSNYYMKDD